MSPLSKGKALIVTDDDVFAHSLGGYVRADGIRLERVSSAELIAAITARTANAIVIDMAATSVDASLLMAAATRAVLGRTPCLLMSSQSRAEVRAFAAVIRAADVICKREPLVTIAARLRFWIASSQGENQADQAEAALPMAAVMEAFSFA